MYCGNRLVRSSNISEVGSGIELSPLAQHQLESLLAQQPDAKQSELHPTRMVQSASNVLKRKSSLKNASLAFKGFFLNSTNDSESFPDSPLAAKRRRLVEVDEGGESVEVKTDGSAAKKEDENVQNKNDDNENARNKQTENIETTPLGSVVNSFEKHGLKTPERRLSSTGKTVLTCLVEVPKANRQTGKTPERPHLVSGCDSPEPAKRTAYLDISPIRVPGEASSQPLKPANSNTRRTRPRSATDPARRPVWVDSLVAQVPQSPAKVCSSAGTGTANTGLECCESIEDFDAPPSLEIVPRTPQQKLPPARTIASNQLACNEALDDDQDSEPQDEFASKVFMPVRKSPVHRTEEQKKHAPTTDGVSLYCDEALEELEVRSPPSDAHSVTHAFYSDSDEFDQSWYMSSFANASSTSTSSGQYSDRSLGSDTLSLLCREELTEFCELRRDYLQLPSEKPFVSFSTEFIDAAASLASDPSMAPLVCTEVIGNDDSDSICSFRFDAISGFEKGVNFVKSPGIPRHHSDIFLTDDETDQHNFRLLADEILDDDVVE